ncbi:hypothetical protein Peur_014611 [Populus x canadensis]
MKIRECGNVEDMRNQLVMTMMFKEKASIQSTTLERIVAGCTLHDSCALEKNKNWKRIGLGCRTKGAGGWDRGRTQGGWDHPCPDPRGWGLLGQTQAGWVWASVRTHGGCGLGLSVAEPKRVGVGFRVRVGPNGAVVWVLPLPDPKRLGLGLGFGSGPKGVGW